MSEHQAILDILADTLHEQRGVRQAITSLAEAIANAGAGTVPDRNVKVKPHATAGSEPSEITQEAATTDMFTAEITYAAVAERITALAKTDRPRVKAALDKFGAKNGASLKAEQYADFLELLT